MILTKHAKQRASQRGFNNFTLKIIMNHGTQKRASGGATRVFFGNKEYQQTVAELNKAIQLMDKAKGGNIIISRNNIITVYK